MDGLGNDDVRGGPGNDKFEGSLGDDRLNGGPGRDGYVLEDNTKTPITVDLTNGFARGHGNDTLVDIGTPSAARR
jgi:hypothetical protein